MRFLHASLASFVAVLVVVACKSTSIENQTTNIGTQCLVAAPAGSSGNACVGSVCALGYCRQPCETSKECEAGSVCLADATGAKGCRLAQETRCSGSFPCVQGLACASDGTCRNACAGSGGADCPIAGQSCKDGACFSGDEPAPITPTGGDGGPTVTPDGAPAGCSPACGPGFACVGGTCAPCGSQGAVCCEGVCGANLTCGADNTCACGAAKQACCGGSGCNAGLSCKSGTCACGASGEACCPGSPATCSTNLACAGRSCTCLTACAGSSARRADGTVWQYASGTTPQRLNAAGGAAVVVQSLAERRGLSAGHLCGVRADGTVVCWKTMDGGGATQGELGDGTTTQSFTPVQVVTSVLGTPLTGMTRVFVGPSLSCATNAAGDLWCWGAGQGGRLADGGTANSPFAVPARASAGGAQFTGVAEVAIAQQYVCARKTNGSLWCWGQNSSGQLGNGTVGGNAPYPAQVTSLFNTVTSVSAGGNTTCATTNDGSAWCWGSNHPNYNSLGSDQVPLGGNTGTPVKVLTAAGGAAFSGAARVDFSGNVTPCALKTADKSVWCWGVGGNQDGYPKPFTTDANVAVSGVFAFSGSCLLDVDGKLLVSAGGSGSPVTTPVPCP
jgi:hypothetical protein